MAKKKDNVELEEDTISMESLRDLLRKELKNNNIFVGGDPLASDVTEFISTNWTLLDCALGGGLPLGRTVELYGQESSGKSTLAYQCIASCQAGSGIPILIDAEQTFNKDMARRVGVDLDRLIVQDEDITLENVFSYISKMIEVSMRKFPESPILIIWDTLAATPTEGEMTGEGQTGGPYRARIIREGMRATTSLIAKSNACLLILNHVHEIMAQSTWGSGPKLVTSGGMGVKFHATSRIYLRPSTMIRDEDKTSLGQEVVAKIEKNKLGSPRGEVRSRFYYGGGFRDEWSIFDYLKEEGIIKQSGAWASIPYSDGTELKTYPSKFLDLLVEKPDLLDHLKSLTIEQYAKNNPDYFKIKLDEK